MVVLPTGFVILLGNLIPDSEVTFAVTVKDRGDHSDGKFYFWLQKPTPPIRPSSTPGVKLLAYKGIHIVSGVK